jgi:hypothetical protein
VAGALTAATGALDPPPVASHEQRYRISAEVGYLLDRMIEQSDRPDAERDRLLAEARWWAGAHEQPLLTVVHRSFLARQLCLRCADSDGTWRNALSYIGDPDPLDRAVCGYDYDRAEITFGPESPLARPYGWADGTDCRVQAWYARTGMAAITTWLIAVARMATERGQRHLVLSNRLYHETGILFDTVRLQQVETRAYDDCDALLAAAAAASGPVVVFLDSSRPQGDAATVARVLREANPEQVSCVVWDNTCAPATESPFGADLPLTELATALLLIRSHAKLDQLGLEFCALGSMAMLAPAQAAARPAAQAWWEALDRFVPETLAVTGVCASPAAMRLLVALGLPNPRLSEPANEYLRAANTLAGQLLAEQLDPTGRYRVECSEHRCFVEIHILDLPGPENEIGVLPTWPAWDDLDRELTALEQDAARDAIPVWKSASFGFHYTGLSWYSSDVPPRPRGCPHTVLRLCVGMHDPEVTARVTELVVRRLVGKQAWGAPA